MGFKTVSKIRLFYLKAAALFFSLVLFVSVSFVAVLSISPIVDAYSSCTSGAKCDFQGQTCRHTFSNGCWNTPVCGCTTTSKTHYWLEPYYKDCFCISQLDVNTVYDGRGTNEDSSVGFEIFVSEGTNTYYEQKSKTVYDTKCFFNGGGDVSCPIRDPPVECRLYLTGPGVSNQLVGSKVVNVDPERLYLHSFRVPSNLLDKSGTYTATLDCGIQLPANSEECVSSCSTAFSKLSFGITACKPSVSVSADRFKYKSGDVVSASGVLRNEGKLVSGDVTVELRNSADQVVASKRVSASGGRYSVSFATGSLSSGSYSVVARGSYDSCSEVSSSTIVEFTKCDVSLSASTVSESVSGKPVVLSGKVSNAGQGVPARIFVSTVSNGQTVGSQEVFSASDGSYSLSLGPFPSGSYASTLSAHYDDCPAASTVRSFDAGCDLTVSAQADSSQYFADDFVSVSGEVKNGGSLTDASYTVLLRNSNGRVVGQKSGSTSNGLLSVDFGILDEDSYTAVVQASSGECSASTKVNVKTNCDIDAKVVQLPKCFGNEGEFYVVQIDNKINAQNELSLSYSSALKLLGPARLSLLPFESRLFNVSLKAPVDVVGDTIGLINIYGNVNQCVQKVKLPFCIRGGVSIEAPNDKVFAFTGEEACFPVTLRNRRDESVIAALSSRAFDSFNTDFIGEFNVRKVRLTDYEIRDDLRYCVEVPSNSEGTHIFTLREESAINDDEVDVTLEVKDRGDISSSYSGQCIRVDEDSRYPITFTNNFEDGDFFFEVNDYDALGAVPSPSALINFEKGSSRTVYLSFDSSKDVRFRYADLFLKKDGKTVLQKTLCFKVGEEEVDEPSASSSLFPSSVSSLCGSASTSTLRVRNEAGSRATYRFSASSGVFDVSFSPSSLSLAANSEGSVTVSVTPKLGASAGSYSIPITVSLSSSTSGGDGSQARVECGNSNTVSSTFCTGSSGLCSANCYYSGASGTNYLSGSLRGVSCHSTRVTVGENQATCVLSSSPNRISSGGSSTVIVDYKNLPYTPGSISINCGNGNTVTASSCSGTDGSCTAVCHYPDSGIYTVTSSASGSSCASTQVNAGSSSPWCALSPTSLFLSGSGGSTTVNVYYYNIPENYYGSTTYTTGSYSVSETLTATLSQNCPLQSFGTVLSYVSGKGTPRPGVSTPSYPPAGPTVTPVPSDAGKVAVSLNSLLYSYSIDSGVLNVTAEFSIENTADGSVSLSPFVSGLPDGWNITIAPRVLDLSANEKAIVVANLLASNVESKKYNATFDLTDDFGKTSSFEFTVDAEEGTGLGNILSGFFVLGSQDSLLLFLLAILLLFGFALIYKARRNYYASKELEEGENVENE